MAQVLRASCAAIFTEGSDLRAEDGRDAAGAILCEGIDAFVSPRRSRAMAGLR